MMSKEVNEFQLDNLTRNSRMANQTAYNDSSIRTDESADYRPAP
jgi:hypothetical protein